MLQDIKGLNSTGQMLCWWEEKGRQGGFQHWGVFTPLLCPAWAVLEGGYCPVSAPGLWPGWL